MGKLDNTSDEHMGWLLQIENMFGIQIKEANVGRFYLLTLINGCVQGKIYVPCLSWTVKYCVWLFCSEWKFDNMILNDGVGVTLKSIDHYAMVDVFIIMVGTKLSSTYSCLYTY